MIRRIGFSFSSLIVVLGIAIVPAGHAAELNPLPTADSTGPCARFAEGSIAGNPPSLFSRNGVLKVSLAYNTAVDADGRTLYCFTTPDGKESPTLHVRPGDRLIVKVTNNLPAPVSSGAMRMETPAADVCGASSMGPDSVNVHFHGTNTSPVCHQDEVIHTLINSGESFTYNVKFPADEPPGLYWYHPHVHGIADQAVMGGASGAIVVDGLERVQPAVAGLAERVFVIRDQNVAGKPVPGGPDNVPSWDLTLNYVPIAYPDYTPAIINIKPGEKQLWRVVNACADTQLDLQLLYDGQAQTLQVVGLDGVPTGSQDGTRRGKIVKMTDVFIPVAGRAEFIVTGPSKSVQNATFLTLNIDTGPIGDVDPTRPLATLVKPDAAATAAAAEVKLPTVPAAPGPQRFEGLADAKVTATRTLYFSEVISDARSPRAASGAINPEDWLNTQFFITVDGQTPAIFEPYNPPAITTTQGSVEDWTIENRNNEVHEFHMHQIHFLLLAKNGVPVPKEQQQFYDMIQVPYWSGSGPYPSVTVRMDFRGPDIGDFVYHCHILAHEDGGMMAIIRVLPREAGWLGPNGKFRTMFASIGWPYAPEISAWCVNGRTLDRGDRLRGAAAAQMLLIGGLMLLLFAGFLIVPRAAARIAAGLKAIRN
ncbi:MAG TPA: multicopper oxidase domain-containing protein [Candidatus Binataceae bacterium]|nr:multicopper oxidase domain-containing protein [Candidatus Binataceae bacterium]